MAPDVTARYQRASDLLDDVLAARAPGPGRRTPSAIKRAPGGREERHAMQSRLRPREAPTPRFCWQCRKPLHARTDRCPFCGETQ
jgi:hypothetical protein